MYIQTYALGKYTSTVQHILARLIWSKSSTLPIVLSPIFLHFLLNYVILSQKIYGGTYNVIGNKSDLDQMIRANINM